MRTDTDDTSEQRPQTERRIMNDILRAFATRPDIRLWRANVGVAFKGSRVVRFGVVGQADLTGILPGGIRLEIECKSPTGQQRPEQADYQRMIERFGGVYVLARSVGDVQKAIGGYLNGRVIPDTQTTPTANAAAIPFGPPPTRPTRPNRPVPARR